jgi:hypothetical protein
MQIWSELPTDANGFFSTTEACQGASGISRRGCGTMVYSSLIFRSSFLEVLRV